MKKSNTIITLIALLTSILFFSNTTFAQLTGGNIYPINGVENPPTSFRDMVSAVAYLTANGVSGSGDVILELSPGYPGDTTQINIGSISGTSSTLGITFRPAVGYTALTQIVGAASPNQHAINLAGSSYVTLDGRGGGLGTSRDWTVKVTGTNGQMAVRLNNNNASMTGINVRYLNMTGESGNTTGAVFQITGNTTNTINNVVIEENYITSTADTTTRTRGYGVTFASASNVGNTGIIFRNNEITDFYSRGINLTGGFPDIQVYGNSIYHTKAITQPSTVEFFGIYFSTTASAGASLYNNYIYDFRLTNGSTGVNGMYLFNANTTGNSIKVYNNRISFGNLLTGTSIPLPVHGLRENTVTGGLVEIYYNSVYIDGEVTSGANNSAAFRKQSSNVLNLKNNIFFNARTNNGGTGTNWGIMTNNTSYAGIGNNDYFANGSGGVLGTTDGTITGNQATLAGWFGAVGSDVSSVSQNPNYLAGLKIDTTIPSQLESGGTPITDITTDFEGETRNSTTPDIGADEFNGLPQDLVPPTTIYSEIGNQTNLLSVGLTATITDISGIDTAANSPRMYLKKGLNGVWVYDSNPSVSSSDYTFSIDYATVGGVTPGDTMYYYVAAQDLLTNAGTNPGGGSGSNPPGTTPPATPNSYLIVNAPMAGVYTVGLAAFNSAYGKNIYFERRTSKITKDLDDVNSTIDRSAFDYDEKYEDMKLPKPERFADVVAEKVVMMENGKPFDYGSFSLDNTLGIYPTLTSAINDLVGRGMSGAVVFSLVDSYYPNETYPLLIPTITGADSINTITIKPATGITAEIPGNISQPTSSFQLGGASYVVVDGSNLVGGTSQNLTISAQTTTAPAVHFYSGSSNNIIKNVIVQSKNTSTGSGSLIFGSGTGSMNNLIENCTFKRVDTSAVVFGTGAYFFSTTLSSNNLFIDNRFIDFADRGITCQGAVGVSGNKFISNEIYQINQSLKTTIYGFYIGRGPLTVFEGNYIHDLKSTGATPTIAGVYYAGASGEIMNVQLINNVISIAANYNQPAGVLRGIDYFGWAGNSVEIYNNSIFINGDAVTGSSVTAGITKRDDAVNYFAKNNSVFNNRSNGTGTGKHYAVYVSDLVVTSADINNNDYFVNGIGGVLGYWGTADQIDLVSWQDTTGLDINSISANPQYVSLTDLQPQLTSPLLEAGVTVPIVINDYLGVLRGNPPTIGAFEEGILVPLVEPSDLIAVADTFAVLLTWTDNSSNELGFFIERKNGDTLSVDPYVVVDTVGVDVVSSFDLGRTPNTTYTYRIQAYNSLGVSSYSNEVTTTTIIPVELTSFAANVTDQKIALVWSTATELNNQGFDIERKLDGEWQKIAFVSGKGTTTEKSDYSYNDPFKFQSYQGTVNYRLKQIDFDGTYAYSQVASVEVDFTPKEYSLYQNYPNPFNPSTTIKFALPFDSNVRIVIYNLLGEQVSVLFDQIKEVGYHNINFNASTLTSGIYIYTIDAKSIDGLKNYSSVKKMMLVK